MNKIDEPLIQELMVKAAKSPRRRAHHRLHPTLEDPIQRMAVIFNRGAYVQPHRHIDPKRWELFAILRGSAVVLCFSDNGHVTQRVELSASGPNIIVEIEGGQWHTVTAIEDNSLLLESKPGPYYPLDDKDFAAWAPAEGESDCERFAQWFLDCEPGSRLGMGIE